MKTKIVEATQELIDLLKPQLRKIDDAEIRASDGRSAADGLQVGFEKSALCWIALHNDNPVACFGVAPMSQLGTMGVPWFLATDDLPKYTRDLVKLSKPYILKMLDKYPMLCNWRDERNQIAKRWLKWCGFVFSAPEEYGVERRKFSQFFIDRSLV